MLNIKHPGTKHSGNLEHYEKTKSKDNRNIGRRNQAKGIESIFNQIIVENFPNLKREVPIKVQETYKIPDRLDQKIPSPHNKQKTKHTEQRRNTKNCKGE